MRVLLTGANGFLGKELAHQLLDHGYDLVKTSRTGISNTIKCNLDIESEARSLIKDVNPEVIIHAAAVVPKRVRDYYDEDAFVVNESMVRNLTIDSNIDFVYISSMTVYGDANRKIYSETDSCSPVTPYGISKMNGELIIKGQCKRSVSIRIPGLYSEKRCSGLIHNTIKGIISNEKVTFPSEPIVWAAMHVKDASYSIVHALRGNEMFFNNAALNVGYSNTYSINRFLDDCKEVFGVELFSSCEHPDFNFDLNNLSQLASLPECSTLKQSLYNMKKFYERNYREIKKCFRHVNLLELGERLKQWKATSAVEGHWEGSQFKAKADEMAHAYLSEKLKLLTPQILVVSEEDLDSLVEERPGKYWLIDPIDGTASYIGGFSGYVTQVAFIENGSPVLSAIYAPSLDLLYSAEKGKGAYLNGNVLTSTTKRSSRKLIDNYPTPKGIAKEIYDNFDCDEYIESGSLGLKLVRVADGNADLFVKNVIVRDWDLAPADLILSEVGARLTDINGDELVYSGGYEVDGIICTRTFDLHNEFCSWLSKINKG